jgi:hypothetical protein
VNGLTQCKAVIEYYPSTQCSRKAKDGCEYCWQHDPKPRHAKRRQQRLKEEWLADLREARGRLDRSQCNVCELAKQWGLCRTPGEQRPRESGDRLMEALVDLKKCEQDVVDLLTSGRAAGWT